MPRATRARAARGALKEKSAADANVPAVEGVMAAKAVDGIARGAADGEAAGTMFNLENELQSIDVEGTHLTNHALRARIDAPRASPPPHAALETRAWRPRRLSWFRAFAELTTHPLPPAVERRCAQLHEASDAFAARVRKELRAQLTKVSKKTRGMTLRAFLAQHGEDVRVSLAETLREAGRRGDFSDAAAARADANSSRVMKSAETSAEKFRKRGRAATAAAAMLDAAGGVGGGAGASTALHVDNAPPCTPADRGVGGSSNSPFADKLLPVARTPGTARGPRRGEVLYSRNGSPLGALAAEDGDFDRLEQNGANGAPSSCVKRVTMTSRKRRRTEAENDLNDAPGLVLTTDDGKEIDVAAVPADGAEVEETMGMLAKMQAQVAAHMARLMAGRR
jgi:hypothetical protein